LEVYLVRRTDQGGEEKRQVTGKARSREGEARSGEGKERER